MTVKITKPALNLREELADLRKPSGIAGEAVLRADTTADAREAVELSNVADSATGVDVSGTVTADGLVVDAGTSLYSTDATLSNYSASNGVYLNGNSNGWLRLNGDRTGNQRWDIFGDGGGGYARLLTNGKSRLNVANNGDISFYDDTGSSEKFHWDAADEELQLGGNYLALTPVTSGTTGARISANGNGMLRLASGGSDKVYILDSGNVGIGISNPEADLHIGKSANASAGGSKLLLKPSAEYGSIVSNDDLGQIAFGAKTGSIDNTDNDSVIIRGVADGTWASNNYPTRLEFWTTDNGDQNPTEAMRIDSDGHAIIPAGVTLGTTVGTYAAANTLDDYEEGTFTATLKGSSEPASLVTSTSYYTKVGNKVYFEIGLENTDTTGYSGDFFVTGLPFISTGPRAVASVIHYKTTTWSDGHVPVAVVGTGMTRVDCLNQLSGSPWAVNQHSAGTGRYFWITGTYITTS